MCLHACVCVSFSNASHPVSSGRLAFKEDLDQGRGAAECIHSTAQGCKPRYCCREQVYTWQQMLSISFLRGAQTAFSFQPLFVERRWVDLCCQSFAGEGKQMALSGVQTGPG